MARRAGGESLKDMEMITIDIIVERERLLRRIKTNNNIDFVIITILRSINFTEKHDFKNSVVQNVPK